MTTTDRIKILIEEGKQVIEFRYDQLGVQEQLDACHTLEWSGYKLTKGNRELRRYEKTIA